MAEHFGHTAITICVRCSCPRPQWTGPSHQPVMTSNSRCGQCRIDRSLAPENHAVWARISTTVPGRKGNQTLVSGVRTVYQILPADGFRPNDS
jgi:hypothetical protein